MLTIFPYEKVESSMEEAHRKVWSHMSPHSYAEKHHLLGLSENVSHLMTRD